MPHSFLFSGLDIHSFLLCFTGEWTVRLKSLVIVSMKDVHALQINYSLAHFIYCSEKFVCTYKTKKTPSNFCKNFHAYLLHHMRFNELLCAGLVQDPGSLCSASRVMYISHVLFFIHRPKSGVQHLFLTVISQLNAD